METHVLLFLVAIVAGAGNAMAGGGGLLTFPVLMTVVTPVTADATSAVALLPAYVTSTWAGRKHLAPVRPWFWLLLGPSLLGGLLGALLLNWSGNRSFIELIPWLILVATLLTLRPLLTRRPEPEGPSGAAVAETPPLPSISLQVAAGVLLFFVAIYGRIFWRRHWHPGDWRIWLDWAYQYPIDRTPEERLVGRPPSGGRGGIHRPREGGFGVWLGHGSRGVSRWLPWWKRGAFDESHAGACRNRCPWFSHGGILLLEDIWQWDSPDWGRLISFVRSAGRLLAPEGKRSDR
jgi:hypothetical protein